MTKVLGDGRGVAGLAALLADGTRAAFCLALLDGRAWTAGELARHAGVAPSTATDHLTRLVRGGLLVEQRQGRHRYLRLAGPSVAQLIEDLAGHAPAPPRPAGSLRAAVAGTALAYARTCYDHLAGRLGVTLRDGLLRQGLLDTAGGLAITPEGRARLAALGVAVEPEPGSRRPLVRDCLDWTERRSHLAGTLGAVLCRHLFEQGWTVRGAGRAVRLTPAGTAALTELLGVAAADLAPEQRPESGSGRA
ncbi:winged helix-turn-helix domain-containing protein [Micromonospora sp. NPDC050686]|uniref:ArsR/SmtB family transcription factor n=1 Tax=Micromonospora sp. NPDC050686 TaxID=3154631 RepID=UPI0033C1705C